VIDHMEEVKGDEEVEEATETEVKKKNFFKKIFQPWKWRSSTSVPKPPLLLCCCCRCCR